MSSEPTSITAVILNPNDCVQSQCLQRFDAHGREIVTPTSSVGFGARLGEALYVLAATALVLCVLSLAMTAPSVAAPSVAAHGVSVRSVSPPSALERVVPVGDTVIVDTAAVDTAVVDTTTIDSDDATEAGEERMAILIGGMEALRKEIKYPRKARRKGIEGQVFVQFDVSTQGVPTNITVTRSVHPLLDAEAARAVGELRFLPGIKDGEPVVVVFTMPISFYRGRK